MSAIDVTNQCTFRPASGKAFDPNTDTSVTVSYTDEYNVTKTCDFPLSSLPLAWLKLVTPPSKTSYKEGEAINYSGIKINAVYKDESEREVTSSCTYSPQSGSSYALDAKATVSYTENDITKTLEFSLAVPLAPISIEVAKQPSKTSYNLDEKIDYSGCKIMANYPDATSKDVTFSVTFSPASGTSFYENLSASASFTERGVTCTCPVSFQLNPGTLSSIEVTTNPTKMSYKYKDQVNYSGLVVTATYTNGRTGVVTDFCTFSPDKGEELISLPDENHLRSIITYSKDGDTASCNLNFNRILPSEIIYIIPPTKSEYYSNEPLDFSGLKAYIKYSNDEVISVDKTDSRVSFSPAEGSAYRYDYSHLTFKEHNTRIIRDFDLRKISVAKIKITTPPTKNVYASGEPISFSGLVVTATCTDGNTQDVTAFCSFTNSSGYSVSEGTAFNSYYHSKITITYDSGHRCYLGLSESTLQEIRVFTPPIKTSYQYEEVISYAGLSIKGKYADGSEIDVTKMCTFSTPEGNTFSPNTDTTIVVSYQSLSCSFNLTALSLSSLAITELPTTIAYSEGEVIDYSGLVATATYSDNSTKDVTSVCTFSPASGKSFDPSIDLTVTVTYTENEISRFQSFNLTEKVLTELSVANQPNKTKYKFKDKVTYDGLKITAKYSDGTDENVTNNCSFSLPSEQQYNSNIDTTVTVTYTTKTCTFDLYAVYMTTLEIAQLPEKTGYRYEEAISYEGLKVIATYSDNSTFNVTGFCTITPDEGKSFEPSTDSTVAVRCVDGNLSRLQTFNLELVTFSSISIITEPTKKKYRYGDAINYSGLKVVAIYSDDTEENITSECEISPVEGKLFDSSTDTTVTVSYTEFMVTKTTTMNLEEIKLTRIEITNQPTKTKYKNGEVIDYSGLAITAHYADATVKSGVTDECEFSLEEGEIFNTSDSSLDVTVTYTEGNNSKTATLTLTHKIVSRIEITSLPLKTYYKRDERISYLGLIVSAVYSDNSKDFIYNKSTKLCTLSRAEGKAFNPVTDTTVTIVYTTDGNTFTQDFSLEETIFTGISVTAQPTKTAYRAGENINYDGIVVKAMYSSGLSKIITSDCTFSPVAGKAFDASTDTTVTISYIEDGITKTCTMSLTALLFTISVTTSPTKTAYKQGELIDYTGLAVTATYQSRTVDVTNVCTITPAEGKPFDPETDTAVNISYTENNETEVTMLQLTSVEPISIAITHQPTKTSYMMGEVIDYTGLVVTATYADNTTQDVTSFCSFSSGAAFHPTNDETVVITLGNLSTTLALTSTYNNTASINAGNVAVPADEYWHITGTGEVTSNRIMIAAGAVAKLSVVNISTDATMPVIYCFGDADIILDLENVISNTASMYDSYGSYRGYPGIYVPAEYNLTIAGTGTITISTASYAAAIGGGYSETFSNAGNIIIKSGSVTANGGAGSAGIGSSRYRPCGDILITGGTVIATGNGGGAGIGTGYNGTCGNIIIKNTVTQVTATKGSSSTNSIGAGQNGTCGTVTIEDGANVIQN